MKLRRFTAFFMIFIMLMTPSAVFSRDIYATRGEVADMLLQAADFYNPEVVRRDIIKGYEDGSLHEDYVVSRAEALVMLSRAFGNLPQPVGHNKRVALTADDFADIPVWAEEELASVFDSGIVAGTGAGVFSPNDSVTKEQMELFIERVYALYGSNPNDDFYAAVNKELLEELQITPGNATAGTMENLQLQATKQLDLIINSVASRTNTQGSPAQKIADFYRCIVDTESRNKAGIKPIAKYIERIDAVKNITELTMMSNVLSEEVCVNTFLKFALTVDFDDSSKYILYFETMQPILNRELYFEEGDKKDAYINYLKTLLTLGGEEEETALSNAKKYYEFEKTLAQDMLSTEAKSDINNIYNLNSYNKLSVMFPDFDLDTVLKNCGLTKADRIVVGDMGLTESFARLYNQSNLDVLKTSMKIALLVSCGMALSEDFVRAEQELDRVILGVDGAYDVSQQAVLILQDMMPEYLGKLYVEKYFDEESKKDVEKMTYDIINVFKDRIDNLSWMSEQTKEKAKLKLSNLTVKIGYPEIQETYLDNVNIISPKRGGTYFDNLISVSKETIKYYGALQFADVRHDMWIVEPYTVNAAYNASSNDITLPAAILQSPFYDKNASYEKNLGGIGYIIAHEITHAFDSNGAQFDENGNVNNWWTEEDYSAFALLCEDVVSFFDGIETIPAVQNNGKLTLDENIADLGAAACITQLARECGNADYKTLYESMAYAWANTSSREYEAYAAQTDVHSSRKLRINRVLVNIEEFYEAFNITESDGMYVKPENRISIW